MPPARTKNSNMDCSTAIKLKKHSNIILKFTGVHLINSDKNVEL